MSLGARLASSHTERVRGAGAELELEEEEGGLAHTPPVSGIRAMAWNSDQLVLVGMSAMVSGNKIPDKPNSAILVLVGGREHLRDILVRNLRK